VELESWDAWISDDKMNAAHAAASRCGNRFSGKRPTEQELEPEVDYFQEMQLEPSISRTKKVRISLCVCSVLLVLKSLQGNNKNICDK